MLKKLEKRVLTLVKILKNKIKEVKEPEKKENIVPVKIIDNKIRPTSKEVIDLINRFKPQNNNIDTGTTDKNFDGTYEIFLNYIKNKRSLGEPFPRPKEINSDLKIGKNKRLKFCGDAVEEGLLIKPTDTSFDYNPSYNWGA